MQSVNLELLHARCPDVAVISYDANYEKQRNRLGIMEMAVSEPKRAGMTTYYLPRGIMTWAGEWPMKLSLPEFWRAEMEDIAGFEPDGVWWFGSGTGSIPEGARVSVARLKESGYADGTEARRALLKTIKDQQSNT